MTLHDDDSGLTPADGPEAHTEWVDGSVIEAASWRLASELVRRHPSTTRLYQTHPCSEMYDCLSIVALAGSGHIDLNRVGSIHIHTRFDERESNWQSTSWEEYLRAPARDFLARLESAAGLSAPPRVPASTPATLTNRVLATVAASEMKTVNPVRLQGAFVPAGDSCDQRGLLREFGSVRGYLATAAPDDLPWTPGHRFWVVARDEQPIVAITCETGLVFRPGSDGPLNLLNLYAHRKRDLLSTAAHLMTA